MLIKPEHINFFNRRWHFYRCLYFLHSISFYQTSVLKFAKLIIKKMNNNIEQEIVSKLNNLAWIKCVFNKK